MSLFRHPAILWFIAPFKVLGRFVWRFPRACIITLAVLGVIGGTVELLIHHIDATRAIYKKMKAKSPYKYERIETYILETDPNKLIRLGKNVELKALHEDLIRVTWGDLIDVRTLKPTEVKTIPLPGPLDADLVSTVERLSIIVDQGYEAHPLIIHPKKPNGRLVIYQHGYAGVFLDFPHVINALLEAGFTVLGNNYPGYGENWLKDYFDDRFGPYQHRPHLFMNYAKQPLRYYFDPLAAGINYAQEKYGFSDVAMIGFSAGGWATAVYAALDSRVRLSYPVAGILPLYTKLGDRPPEHYYRPLIHTANYLEMYVMAAGRPGHRQLQVFNQFDRCCYGNRYGELFAPTVDKIARELGGNGFRVFIDTSHADHKISDDALDLIMEDLQAAK